MKDSFGLAGGASDYSLTNCGNCTTVEGMDDSKEFNDTLAAMKVGVRVCLRVWPCCERSALCDGVHVRIE